MAESEENLGCAGESQGAESEEKRTKGETLELCGKK
jgi:hypothetical protein